MAARHETYTVGEEGRDGRIKGGGGGGGGLVRIRLCGRLCLIRGLVGRLGGCLVGLLVLLAGLAGFVV